MTAKLSLEVSTIAQICYAGVTALREALTKEPQPEWDALQPEDQGKIVDYIVMVLTGRPTPDTPEGEVIRRICSVLRSEKKTLKYA
ncbi:hypothetical protein [Buttiauxella sp. A111]|uniref:hypothetical protein n=1 Tax=Buttiauxella sp. A111 TaxID=2563088 RepID=UPI0010ED1BB8|nr:hypothetical protein [Buttiauxella sp. A111]GDX06341.1 hypothetical protein BSPA111_25500 [Buttiauxella sp. A111]